jgi:hypothetical protein
VGPPICDVRLIGLIPGAATQAGARNGFEEPRDRAAKIAGIANSRSTETTRPSFERRKSPQIGAYSSETGNRRFVQEWVVANAVAIEPVSAPNSLLTGKRTGNFCRIRPCEAIFARRQPANSMPCREIPYATDQGIIGAITN